MLELLEDRLAPALLTVNTLQDGNPPAFLSLREAVNVVNSGSTAGLTPAQQAQIDTTNPLGSNDTIQFASGLSGAITLTGGEIDLSQNATISGPGAGVLAVSGNAASRIFGTNAAVSISGLTVTDGASNGAHAGAINLTGGSLSLTDCVLSNNHVTGEAGGAIESVGAALTIAGCTFTGNSADGNGGAIDSPGVNVTITGATFDHNSSGNGGGALSIGAGTVNLTNDTFTANSAPNGSGGAVNSNFAATFNVLSCTIAGNSAASGGGIAVGGGTFNLADAIVANNTAQVGNDINGAVVSGGYNLIRDASFATIIGTSTGNQFDVDPVLGPLADNGGPTHTMALAVGSGARDQIPAGAPTPPPAADQRGVARPVGALADIGAVEEDHNVFLVTNTNTSGSGSLAQAILDSNSTPLLAGSPNLIQFDIPGSGVQDIALTSALPQVAASVIIDGYSQPGAAPNTLALGDNAVIEIDLTNNSSGIGNGLDIAAANVTVQGLGVSGFNTGGANPSGNNILIEQTATNAVIRGNYIGLLPDGSSGGLNVLGIFVNDAANALIGGATSADRNVLISNGAGGVNITGSNAAGGVIAGNYIGANPVGAAGMNGNGGNGIELDSVNGVAIGGNTAAAGNVISANSGAGILLNLSSNDVIGGNLIGTNPAGNAALGNGGNGITVDGTGDLIGADGGNGFRNVISGNGGNGVELDNGDNTVAGNFIGADITGAVAVGNGGDGVQVSGSSNNTIGGATAALRNVISGNGGSGIVLTNGAAGNTVEGNYIGADVIGATALGNNTSESAFGAGVVVAAGASSNMIGVGGAGNVISGNNGPGVWILGATANKVQHNRIGTDAAGDAAIPNTRNGVQIDNEASNNLIGVNAADANAAAEGNQISGNDGEGVVIGFNGSASGNVVAGNLIGLNAAGAAALGNALDGVSIGVAANNTIGTTTGSALERNVISGNGQFGVSIFDAGATGNVVAGNFIGTDGSGATAAGNALAGVFIGFGASNNTVGGTAAGAGNVISGNGGDGVDLSDSGTSGNAIQGNFIGAAAGAAAKLGNGADGVRILGGATSNTVGGSTAGAGNLISGNGANGVELVGAGTSGNLIAGNRIGTDVNGAAVLGNGNDGVLLRQGASSNTVGGSGASANLIAGNAANAVEINETAAVAAGNRVQGLSRSTDTLTYVAQSGGVTTSIDFSAGAISGPGVSNTFAGLSAVTLDANGGTADLQGGAFADEVETPSAAAAGSVAFDGSFTVNYRNVAQLQDTAPLTGTATYNGTASAELIDIVDGGTVDGFQATRLDSGASNTFAPVLFANKPAVVVNGESGADVFTVNNPNPAAGLATLNLDTGASAGSTIAVQATPATVTTNVVGGASITVNVGNGGSVQGILGTLNLEAPAPGAVITATVDDSADPTARTVTLGSFAPNPSDSEGNGDVYGKISGLAPADINYEYADTAVLTLDGPGGGSVYNVNSTVPGTPGTTTINGGIGADTFNISGPDLGANSVDNFNGGAGDDVFNVTGPVSAGAAIGLDGGAGTNTLNYDLAGGNATVTPTGPRSGSITQSNGALSYLNASPVVKGGGTGTLNYEASQGSVGTLAGALTLNGVPAVTYTGIPTLHLNDAAGVNAIYGPNTADRGQALAGLMADERFVQVLYLGALGRAGSKAEIDGWASLFAAPGLSQAQAQADIAARIEHTAEGRDHLVRSWYVTYLGRQTRNGEEQGFVNLLLAGQTEEQALSVLLSSTEFYSRAQTLGFGDTADGDYVRALYRLLLNRAASAGEVTGWENALAGTSRQSVALAFLGTQEFRTDDFEGYYNALLHRPSDAAGLNSWVMSNLDVGAVRIGFETSPEFFANG